MTDDPDLERLDRGDEVTVYYNSNRSGNEVDRTGTVSNTLVSDDGEHIARIHVDRHSALKRQYVALAEVESDGEEFVAAFSLTAEAEIGMEPPQLGRHFSTKFTTTRTTYLGTVDRIVREDGPGPFLVT